MARSTRKESKVKVVPKDDLEDLKAFDKQISSIRSSRYYVYSPIKSYTNKMERVASKLNTKPSMLVIDKHTGKVLQRAKTFAVA